MRKRIRNLLALFICFSLVVAESSMAFAEKGVTEAEASAEEGQILGTGSGTVSGYTIAGDLEYGATKITYYCDEPGPWTILDKDGDEAEDFDITIRSVKYNGKEYYFYEDADESEESKIADFSSAYRAGLKVGDKVDLTVCLEKDSATSETQTDDLETVIKDVEIKKRKITEEDVDDLELERGVNLKNALKNNRFTASVDSGYGTVYMKLTDSGLAKVGSFSEDEYELEYGKDFTYYVEESLETKGIVDITDNFDFDLEGFKLKVYVENSYYVQTNLIEVQAGTTAEKLRESVKNRACFYKNDELVDIDASKLEFTSYESYDNGKIEEIAADDDEAITKAMSEPGKMLRVHFKAEMDKKDGKPVYQSGYKTLYVMKNAYNIYLDNFEEVAHATGASYENTKHDFMVNLYALKNETEKIRVGSMGDGERFGIYIWDADDNYISTSENAAFFSGLRGGEKIYFVVNWFLPIPDDDRTDFERTFYYGDYLKFRAYDSSKDLANPASEAHKNDGQAIEKLPEGAPAYEFNAETYNTLVAGVKVNIADKFKSYVSLNGYVESAKHRYKVDNKKIANVDKKGNVNPKKNGKILISLEQKEKGSGWKQIGEPIELFVQVPEMKKDAEGAVGATLNARDLLGKTTFAPTSWKSSKPAVADVDPKTGVITIKKKGKAKIIAVYGDGKSGSKNKYKTKLKVNG